MRELKFRVAIYKRKRHEEEKFDDVMELYSGLELTDFGCGNYGSFFYSEGKQISIAPDMVKFRIDQFTGLYDRSGKQIYEGDILNYAGMMDTPFIVLFMKGAFYACWRSNETLIGLPPYCEVIGNIHENPELLK